MKQNEVQIPVTCSNFESRDCVTVRHRNMASKLVAEHRSDQECLRWGNDDAVGGATR